MMTTGRNNRANYHTRRMIEDELAKHIDVMVENEDRDQQLVAYKEGSSDSKVAEIVEVAVKRPVTVTNVSSVRRLCFGRLRLDPPEAPPPPPEASPAPSPGLDDVIEGVRVLGVRQDRLRETYEVILKRQDEIEKMVAEIRKQANNKIGALTNYISEMEKRWRKAQPNMEPPAGGSPELPLF
jgi:hypothetical protein